MPISVNVKRYREAAGLSQRDLAGMIGTDQSMIAAVELGTKTPSLHVTVAIAKALGITLDQLVGNEMSA